MAGWPALKNSAFTIVSPIYDADGDVVTAAADLDSEVSIDGGTFADCTNEATEIATSSGIYTLALTAAEMNGDRIATITKTTTTGAKTGVNVIYTSTRQIDDLCFPTVSGRSIDVETTGEVGINLDNVVGTLSDAEIESITVASVTGSVGSVAGNVDGSVASVTGAVGSVTGNVGGNVTGTVASVVGAVGSVAGNVDGNVTGSTASVVGAVGSVTGAVGSVTGSVGSVTGAVGSVTGAVGSVAGNVGGNVTGSVGSVAAGGIAAASFAASAIDAAAVAADAATEIADALLSRDIDQVEATAALHSLTTAILKAVSRVRDNAGTLEVYRTDGLTLHMSQTITTDAAADPIDELTAGV